MLYDFSFFKALLQNRKYKNKPFLKCSETARTGLFLELSPQHSQATSRFLLPSFTCILYSYAHKITLYYPDHKILPRGTEAGSRRITLFVGSACDGQHCNPPGWKQLSQHCVLRTGPEATALPDCAHQPKRQPDTQCICTIG